MVDGEDDPTGTPSHRRGAPRRRGRVVVAVVAVVAVAVAAGALAFSRRGGPDPQDLLAAHDVTDEVLGQAAWRERVRLVLPTQDHPPARIRVYVSCTGRDVARVYLDGTWSGGVPCGSTTAGEGVASVTIGDPVDLGVEHVVEVEAAPDAAIAVTVAVPREDVAGTIVRG
jgi:hypothetical protein